MRALKWQLLFLFILALAIRVFLYSGRLPATDAGPYYMSGCAIFNSDLEIVRRLPPAYICVPTADGGWLSADTEKLIRHAADGSKLWEHSGFYSHRLQFMNPKSVLVLLTEYKKIKNEVIRFDVVQKLDDLTGEVAATFSLYENLFLHSEANPYQVLTDSGEKTVLDRGVKREASHLNSISITDDAIYVGDSHRPTLVLSHDLKFRGLDERLTEKLKLGMRFEDMKHDIQYFADGGLLVFLNQTVDQANNRKTFKVIEFRGNEKIFEFPLNTSDYAESSCCGGVEKIGENYLIGFREKDPGRSVIGIVSKTSSWLIKKSIPFQIQEIKKIPFPDYLQLNRAG